MLFLGLGAAANAKPGKLFPSQSSAFQISHIDAKLEQATTYDDLKKILVLMSEFVMLVEDTCKKPTTSDFKRLCLDLSSRAKISDKDKELFTFMYEKRMWDLACVDIGIDSEETAKLKVQKWWNKYKTNCKCDSVAFGLQNGNYLKFALSQNMPEVIETIASSYGGDINFIDPADGLNLLDYIIAEIARLKKLENSTNSVSVYEEYKATVIGLGGKSNKKYNSY